MRRGHPTVALPPGTKLPKYLYHGAVVDDPLEILFGGLLAREDRKGISLTSTATRARMWGAIKRGIPSEVLILRVPRHAVGQLVGDTLAPAEPDKDFITKAREISPVHLAVRVGSEWVPMIEAYGELLEPAEMAEWERRWRA